jgi:hypothetical protein
MTRKDYVALAAALAKSRPDMGEDGSCDRYGYEVWYHAFELIADALEQDNPRFDRLRFAYAAAADRNDS